MLLNASVTWQQRYSMGKTVVSRPLKKQPAYPSPPTKLNPRGVLGNPEPLNLAAELELVG